MDPLRPLALVLIVTALAGCFGGQQEPLTQQEAEQRAESAVEGFADAFGTPDGGDIKEIHGTFDGEGVDGFGSLEMSFEWGSNDVRHIDVSAGSGGMSFNIEVWCDDDRSVVGFGDDNYESRPGGEDDDFCNLEEEDGLDSPFDPEAIDEEPTSVVIGDDNTITATFTTEEGTFTATIDPQGRLIRLDFETDDGSGTMEITYGSRDTISFPTDIERLPGSIFTGSYWDSGTFTWDGYGADQEYPLDEFEARVMDGDAVVASFPLDGPASQTEAGFAFTFSSDGNDFLDEDSFTVSHPDWEDEEMYDVVVWDLWADKDIEFEALPGFAVLSAVGLLAGAVVFARRR